MKRRLTVLVFVILASFSSAKAQIENEIKAFVDTTDVMLNNGRRLLVQQLSEHNIEKSKEIYWYLKGLTERRNMSPFSYTDELYILVLLNDWNGWVSNASNFESLYNRDYYYSNFDMGNSLYPLVKKQSPDIVASMADMPLTTEEKSALHIYLSLMGTGKTDETYKQLLTDFHKTFKLSKFDVFLNKYMPYAPIKASMAFSFGPAYQSPTGKLGRNFNGNTGFHLSIDFDLNKVYTSLYVTGGDLKLKHPFSATAKGTTFDFTENEHFSFVEAGLMAGYFAVRNKRFHLAPFVTIAGSSLRSNRFDQDEDPNNKKELAIFNAFSTGPGLHTELKLVEFNPKNPYGYMGMAKNYLSLKLEANYCMIAKTNFAEYKGDMLNTSLCLVWGWGDF